MRDRNGIGWVIGSAMLAVVIAVFEIVADEESGFLERFHAEYIGVEP